jgi:glutamate--cysteine ligase catalytic subunit
VNSLAVLTVGSPLNWGKSLSKLTYVREHGIAQFVKRFQKVKHSDNFKVVWGDEIEYSIVSLDHASKIPRISLRAEEVHAVVFVSFFSFFVWLYF